LLKSFVAEQQLGRKPVRGGLLQEGDQRRLILLDRAFALDVDTLDAVRGRKGEERGFIRSIGYDVLLPRPQRRRLICLGLRAYRRNGRRRSRLAGRKRNRRERNGPTSRPQPKSMGWHDNAETSRHALGSLRSELRDGS
jgi:hypothetical protein